MRESWGKDAYKLGEFYLFNGPKIFRGLTYRWDSQLL